MPVKNVLILFNLVYTPGLFGLPHPYPQEMIPSSVSLPLTLQQEELREAMQNVRTFIQKNHTNLPLTCKPSAHQSHPGNCPLLRPDNLQQGVKETSLVASPVNQFRLAHFQSGTCTKHALSQLVRPVDMLLHALLRSKNWHTGSLESSAVPTGALVD